MGYLLGTFVGMMAVPFAFLMIAGSRPRKSWARVVAILAALLGVYMAKGERGADQVIAAICVLITSSWAVIQWLSSRRKSPLPLPKIGGAP